MRNSIPLDLPPNTVAISGNGFNRVNMAARKERGGLNGEIADVGAHVNHCRARVQVDITGSEIRIETDSFI